MQDKVVHALVGQNRRVDVDVQVPDQRAVAAIPDRRGSGQDATETGVDREHPQTLRVRRVMRGPEVPQRPAVAGNPPGDEVVVLRLVVVGATGPGPAYDHPREDPECSRIGARTEEANPLRGKGRSEVPPGRGRRVGVPETSQFSQRQALHRVVRGIGHHGHTVPCKRQGQETASGRTTAGRLRGRHEPRGPGDVDVVVAEAPQAAARSRNPDHDARGGTHTDEILDHGLGKRIQAAGPVDHDDAPRFGPAGHAPATQEREDRRRRTPRRTIAAGHHGDTARAGTGSCRGTVKVTVVPEPRLLSAVTLPPMLETRWRTMASPSPVPPSSLERAASTR